MPLLILTSLINQKNKKKRRKIYIDKDFDIVEIIKIDDEDLVFHDA